MDNSVSLRNNLNCNIRSYNFIFYVTWSQYHPLCVHTLHTLCFINKNPLTMVAHTLFIKKTLVPKAYYAGGNDDKWARCASRVDRKFSFGEISMVKGPLCLRSSCMYSDAFEHWKFKILIFEKLFYRVKTICFNPGKTYFFLITIF